VVTSRGITSKNVAEKFSFGNASSDINDVLKDEGINTVFIATPHNSHAAYALACMRLGKNVFLEKPLALTIEELEEIKEQQEEMNTNLMVGFNRRFSPLAIELKKHFSDLQEPLVINYRVNAGFIPKDHWTQNEKIGGGRIIGEVCHFIDLIQFFADSHPETVYAQCIHSKNERMKNDDNIAITITCKNGSVGTIIYVANGDKSLPKERIEIFGGGKVGIIDDFKLGVIHSGGRSKTIKLEGKGHRQEVESFLKAIKEGLQMPISFESIYYTTKATFKIRDSLRTGLPQLINE
jgi:polar amino acid transport system substrate-binding protein